MKILIELRTAINVSDNTFLPLSRGDRRTQQYIDGLKSLKQYSNEFEHCDVVLVDNTLQDENQVPQQIKDALPEEAFLYVKSQNIYGRYNKGAGDIEMWKDYSDILTTYDYFFHHEPRMIMQDFTFMRSFLYNPRNYFSLALEDQVKTGYFGVNVHDFYDFYNQVDLQYMVNNFISIENMMFSFFKEKNAEFIADASYCLWHDAASDEYVKY